MDVLGKALFIGVWKSFKFFKHTGDVKFYSPQHYKEFNFSINGWLTIRVYKGDHIEKLAQTDQWTLELINKKHLLKIPLFEMVYEVLTINHTVMVLVETRSVDKLFLAKEPHWNNFLQSNTALVL